MDSTWDIMMTIDQQHSLTSVFVRFHRVQVHAGNPIVIGLFIIYHDWLLLDSEVLVS